MENVGVDMAAVHCVLANYFYRESPHAPHREIFLKHHNNQIVKASLIKIWMALNCGPFSPSFMRRALI